ncbi:MAG: hypothetical protein HC882_00740, partial [Acidobacteria bacterium]|nr:hypothetical protein [Acidobacteriota bacterium]
DAWRPWRSYAVLHLWSMGEERCASTLASIATPLGALNAALRGDAVIALAFADSWARVEEFVRRRFGAFETQPSVAPSVAAAVTLMKARGASDIKLVCLLAAPEGIRVLAEAHPDVRIFTAAVDSHLNDHGYIVPGLGDAGGAACSSVTGGAGIGCGGGKK